MLTPTIKLEFLCLVSICRFSANSVGGSDRKKTACNSGGLDSIPGSGRSPGVGNGNLPQYSCLENSTDRGAWWVSPWGCKESGKTEQLTLSLSKTFY